MRTELEIQQAREILQRAKDGAKARGRADDVYLLGLNVDLLKWVQGEPSAFGPQLEHIRKVIASEAN